MKEGMKSYEKPKVISRDEDMSFPFVMLLAGALAYLTLTYYSGFQISPPIISRK